MKLLSFGEILFDVYPDASYIGGAPLNFAAHFANLGGEAYLCSAIGKDRLGKMAIASLNTFRINTDYVTVTDFDTGRCNVTISKEGVPSYELKEGVAWDNITYKERKEKFDALYFGTLALRSKKNREALKSIMSSSTFSEVFVDINVRPPYYSSEAAELALGYATLLKISDEEMGCFLSSVGLDVSLAPDAASKLISRRYPKLKTVIITLGDKGALCYVKESDTLLSVAAKKCEVVSTVGAGDSFSAAFLYSYLFGKSITECMEAARDLSSYVVSKKEAIPD